MVLVMVRWSLTKKKTITSWSDCIQVRIGITCLNFQANEKLRDYFRRCHAFSRGKKCVKKFRRLIAHLTVQADAIIGHHGQWQWWLINRPVVVVVVLICVWSGSIWGQQFAACR